MENESHSPVVAILLDAKAKAKAVIKAKQAEIADIDRALTALSQPPASRQEFMQAKPSKERAHWSVADAIVVAVEAGKTNPTDIHRYLEDDLGVPTTFGSVRASLSNLKAKGKITLNTFGWVPKKTEEPEQDDYSSLL